MEYSYSALGQSLRGRYPLENSSKFNRNDFTRRIVGTPIQVQYDPEKPSVSALLDSSIEAMLRQQLQVLRDMGLLEFLGGGCYRLT